MDDLMRYPTAIKHDARVDRWLKDQRPDLQPIAQEWFARMRKCGSDVRELITDGCPTACVDDAAFGYVNAFKNHVNVGFFFGAFLNDKASLLEGAGKRMRHVKIRPGQELDAGALGKLIEAAYADIRKRLGK